MIMATTLSYFLPYHSPEPNNCVPLKNGTVQTSSNSEHIWQEDFADCYNDPRNKASPIHEVFIGKVQADATRPYKQHRGTQLGKLSLEEVISLSDQLTKFSSVETFTCKLHKCRKEKNLAYAKYINVGVCNNGLECHRIFGNYIVPLFVLCRSLHDAQQAFNRLVYRNVHSWTALIMGYIECGQFEHGVSLYQKMLDDGIFPSTHSYVAVLKACTRLKDIEKGRQIHVQIKQRGFERNIFVGSSLVDMYAKCGWLKEAKEAFDKLPNRDVITWNALISGYVENGLVEEAWTVFDRMQLEGINPDSVTYICILKTCGSMRAIDKGRKLHKEISLKNFDKELYVGNTLIDMYAKCGTLEDARKVFDMLPRRDAVSWTALIAGYAEGGLGEEALKCFIQMQLEGIFPNIVTFIFALKACGETHSMEKGKEIHRQIAQKELLQDQYIGNCLVEMYAKCHLLVEAQEAFDNLPQHDVVSWNVLITGYIENGLCQDALKCFEKMQINGINPNAITIVLCLKACGSIRAIDKGREIDTSVVRKRFNCDLLVGNAVINMYAKCGLLEEAKEAFDRQPVHDVVSWNTLIIRYTENGFGLKALQCFEQMQLVGIVPDAITFAGSLKACSILGAIDKGRAIHIKVAEEGKETDDLICNALLEMYVKCGAFDEAKAVFSKLPICNTASWTTLIAGYAQRGFAQESLNCFKEMQAKGIRPDSLTFICALKACGSMGAIDDARDIYTLAVRDGYGEDLVVGNVLVDVFAKCGSLNEAKEVFDQLPVRDVVSWTTIMAAYAENGLSQKALHCFEQMKLDGIPPNIVSFIWVLKACGDMRALDKGQELHTQIREKGFQDDSFIGNSLIYMYTKCNSLGEARKVFENQMVHDTISWTILIKAYTDYGLYEEALKSFEQMQLEGISPDAVSFVCILKACECLGTIERGREIHRLIHQSKHEIDILVHISLINMYAKCGSIVEAQEVFYNLQVQNVHVWNAMIKGYGSNHEGKMAIECFKEMKQQGINPDAITFIHLLTACSRANLLCKGQEYFKIIKEEYHIEPTIDHYICMVDLLARAGHLHEAECLLEIASCALSLEAWRALLAACRTYGATELGRKCFERLFHANPEDSAAYVLMSSIYSSANKQDDAQEI